ncbi:MAG: 5-methyltetrahydropteroyltriglutamate--homocysteine S-methyltransferase [Candidatus Berkiellales bacterium]
MVHIAHILGFPRIGKNRELKKALEAYWAKQSDQSILLQTGQVIRRENWQRQKNAGLDFVTVGDFSWYDHVLDTAAMLGVIPERFKERLNSTLIDLDTIFSMARGSIVDDVSACEMTKWFNTNYHYIVPELEEKQLFYLSNLKLFEEIQEAQAFGFNVKPVIMGPLTFLWLAKCKKAGFNKLSLIENLMEIYAQIFAKLKVLKIEWVQVDEPILGLELPPAWLEAFKIVYVTLNNKVKILLTTYFTSLSQVNLISSLPTDGIHVDLTQNIQQLKELIKIVPQNKVFSAGIVDGRNIWKNNLSQSYEALLKAKEHLQERLWIGSSCSLLHVPIDLQLENKIDPEIKSWLSFAVQKIDEIVILAKALNQNQKETDAFQASDTSAASRQGSQLIHDDAVKKRINAINNNMHHRQNPFAIRSLDQHQKLKLPLFPTTTIGSFPQTQTMRHIRNQYKTQQVSEATYEEAIVTQIQQIITLQEELDLDVLVHGEVERSDMVEYFAELLQGFILTDHGWVQSYGSRYVKPPILFGDIRRPYPMTVPWIQYAKSLTAKPVKAILTGPVTMLSWSFVRDDQPPSETAMQIALALRDEVADLENCGINVIQIDEPAFREQLPLKQSEWQKYLEWAVKAFRLASSGVSDRTQIHTHMCYSEFNDIIDSIAALDADVITIETSRSQMELLTAFENFEYPNEIGPGVFDVHSPRIPGVEEMVELLTKATKVISPHRLWVNPDCGLKTRDPSEAKQALDHMVQAAKIMRAKVVKER